MQTTLLGTGVFLIVDIFDARSASSGGSGTPTASQLAAYHAILVISDPPFADPVLMGDLLAAYHDQGGGVVIACFANLNSDYDSGKRLQGAYGTPSSGYALLDYAQGWVNDRQGSLGEVLEPLSPLMVGVTSLSATSAYRSTAPPIAGRAVVVARWQGNGNEPLVLRGTRGNRTLVELNFTPVSSRAGSNLWIGSGAELLRNALKYSRCMQITTTPTPKTSTLAPTVTTSAPPTDTSEMDLSYSVGASGFKVKSASYSRDASAWIIDVDYSKNSNNVLAFFIPRSQVDKSGIYTAEFNSTFSGVNFPCSLTDLSAAAATTCCLTNFLAHYRVPTNYTLPQDPACTSPYANPSPLILQDAISGGFGADMPASGVTALPTSVDSSVSRARFTLALSDVWTSASKVTSSPDGESKTFTTFVGMAQFAAVPGSRILDSASTQTQLTLVYSDYYQVDFPTHSIRWLAYTYQFADIPGGLCCRHRIQHLPELHQRAGQRGGGRH